MTEHTSGLWQSEGSSVYFGTPDTYEDDGTIAWGGFDLRYAPRSHANAAYIVKCVNNHDELVEALRNAVCIIDYEDGTKHIDQARELLAKIDAFNGEKNEVS